MKLFKRIFVTTLILITIGSLSYGAFLGKSMYEKYNNTVKWKNSSLLSKIHQVPPELARNYISIDNQKILEILTDVNIALEEIKKNNEVKKDKLDDYWKLHDYAKGEIEASESHKDLLTKGVFNDFSLYLKANAAINNAYEKLEIDGLEEYEKTFSTRLRKEDNKIEKKFLNELREISKDYENLELFSQDAISKLGVIENNVLEVDVKVNKTMTEYFLSEIKEKKLNKFSHIKKLAETLSSNSWNRILAHNSSSLEYYSWKESQKILDGLLKSNYIPVSSFKNVGDVLSYDPTIRLEQKQNFTINSDSVVKDVYYNSEKLDSNLYVKKGVQLNFVIDYKYTENPKSNITIEYVDIDGNKLDSVTYEGYVDSPINIDRKDIEGYVLVEIKNGITKFKNENSTVQLIYEKYEPEPEPEPEPEIDSELTDEENLEQDLNETNEQTDDKQKDDKKDNVKKDDKKDNVKKDNVKKNDDKVE